MDEPSQPLSKTLSPLFSGMLFGVGWWLFIGAHIVQQHNSYTPHVLVTYYLPGVAATIGLIMSNIVDIKSLNGSSFMAIASPEVSARIRAWLFVALSFHFGAMIAGIWIMADTFLPPDGSVEHSAPGITLMVQTILIFVSSMILLWSKSITTEYDAF